MISAPVSAVDESLSSLRENIADLRELAVSASADVRADVVREALRCSDALTSVAIEALGSGNGVSAATGLPAEMLLSLEARRMVSEARMMTNASAQLRAMPSLAAAFADGTVSWGQVRAIVSAVARLPAAGRAQVDALVGREASRLAEADPDEVVRLVDALVGRLRPELVVAREDRAVEGGFLAIQSRLDGSGGCFYGEADALSLATLTEATDARAEEPVHPGEGPSRAQQRFDALIGICEDSLNGNSSGGSARPGRRVIATLDLNALMEAQQAEGMNLLWNLAGRVGRLSHVSREVILCDPDIVPVVFNGDQPIAVGDAARRISDKVRLALWARDGGCRFPGCVAPAGWADAHHIIPGVGNQVEDLVLLCRRCHRRMHRRKWRARWLEDGGMEFTRRGYSKISYPRHRPIPSRE